MTADVIIAIDAITGLSGVTYTQQGIFIAGTTYSQGDIVIAIDNATSLGIFHYCNLTGAGTSDPSLDASNWIPLTSTGITSGIRSIIYGYVAVSDRVDFSISSLIVNRYSVDDPFGNSFNNKVNIQNVLNFPFGNAGVSDNDFLNDIGSKFGNFTGGMGNCISSGVFNLGDSNAGMNSCFTGQNGSLDFSNITDNSLFSHLKVNGKVISFQNGQHTISSDYNSQYETPATGSTVVCNGCEWLFINTAAPIAVLTIKLPGGAQNGQSFNINTTNAITSLIFSNGTTQISYTTLTAGGTINLIFNRTTITWNNA